MNNSGEISALTRMEISHCEATESISNEPIRECPSGNHSSPPNLKSCNDEENFISAPSSPIRSSSFSIDMNQKHRPHTDPHMSSLCDIKSLLSSSDQLCRDIAFDTWNCVLDRQFAIPLPPRHGSHSRRKALHTRASSCAGRSVEQSSCFMNKRNAASQPSSPTFQLKTSDDYLKLGKDLDLHSSVLTQENETTEQIKVGRFANEKLLESTFLSQSRTINAEILEFQHEEESEEEEDDEIQDDTLTSTEIHENIDDHSSRNHSCLSWSVANQKGYRYADFETRDRLEIHVEMEDMYYPSCGDSPTHIHPITNRPFQLFMLADGHGGHECAMYAVQNIPPVVVELVSSKAWDFSEPDHQEEFKRKLQDICIEFDEEYCNYKLSQFKEWIQTRLQANMNPLDPASKHDKPSDDGCTMIINLIYDDYLINANLGDSRSLLLAKTSNQRHWSPLFASTDHTPGHPERARKIHENGGRFIHNGYTASVNDIFLNKNFPKSPDTTIEYLSRCRIGRTLGWKIDEINFPACTTLNLSGTLGDMFFKYRPSLISPRPDVSFVPVNTCESSFLLMMATDGLWDHMSQQKPEVQNAMIGSFVDQTFAYSGNEDKLSQFNDDLSSTSLPHDEKLRKLGLLAHSLADREMTTSLYLPDFVRYDDVTVFVILIEKQKL